MNGTHALSFVNLIRGLVPLCSALLSVLACGEAVVEPARSAANPRSESPAGPATLVSVPEPSSEDVEAEQEASDDEEVAAERGTLHDCREAEPNIVRCEWRDEYGTGALELSFSSTTSNFEGQWWPEAEPELLHPWTGARIGEVEQSSDHVAPDGR